MLQITLKIKNVYGNDLVYPMCEISENFAKLINKKTFSNYDLKIIEALGYQIIIF